MTPVWTTSRAAGLAALMTASLAISCGLLMALRIPALRRRMPELRAIHQALAGKREVHGFRQEVMGKV